MSSGWAGEVRCIKIFATESTEGKEGNSLKSLCALWLFLNLFGSQDSKLEQRFKAIEMKSSELFTAVPHLSKLMETADHVDIKTIDGDVSLRQFIAGMLSYSPAWLKFLYGVRWFFVRLLGMKQEGVPGGLSMTAERVSFVPGDPATFFSVKMAEEEKYWFAGITESHLTAHLGVVVEAGQPRRFYVVTIVHYHRWTGPIYFNVIRPFHHLVVWQMMKAGVRPPLRLQEA